MKSLLLFLLVCTTASTSHAQFVDPVAKAQRIVQIQQTLKQLKQITEQTQHMKIIQSAWEDARTLRSTIDTARRLRDAHRLEDLYGAEFAREQIIQEIKRTVRTEGGRIGLDLDYTPSGDRGDTEAFKRNFRRAWESDSTGRVYTPREVRRYGSRKDTEFQHEIESKMLELRKISRKQDDLAASLVDLNDQLASQSHPAARAELEREIASVMAEQAAEAGKTETLMAEMQLLKEYREVTDRQRQEVIREHMWDMDLSTKPRPRSKPWRQ